MKRALLLAWLVGCGSSSKPAPAPAPKAPPTPTEVQLAKPEQPELHTPHGHPNQNLISRQILFGNPDRVNVQLSPDGKLLAWLAPKDGVMNVFVAPVDKIDQAKAITSDTKRPIRQYSWSYDKTHLVYLQDTGGDENFHLFRTGVDGGEVVDLTPLKARVQIYSSSPRVPNSIIVGINDRDDKVFDVYSIDIETGKRTLVYQNDDQMVGFDFDSKLALRFGNKIGPDGQVQIFQRTGTKWTLWYEAPAEDDATTGLYELDDNGKTAYMTASRDRDTAAFFAVDIASKKQRLLAENPKADAGDVVFHPTTHKPQAIDFPYDRQHWQALDKSVQPDLDGLAKLADGADWQMGNTTVDDKKWLVSIVSDVSAPRYYLWDRTKKAGTFLFAAQPSLPSDKLAKVHPVVIKSRDGLDMVSYLTLPKAVDHDGPPGRQAMIEAPIPMVLWVHGGPWGRDRWGYQRTPQLFANRGYAVLQVNFRGSTGFGKKFVNLGDRQWGKTMHDDLLDAVDWAIKAGITTNTRVCIAGVSYGGYSTLAGLAFTPDVFRCGVDVVGPANLNTLLATIPSYWKPMRAQFIRRMGDPDTNEGKAALAAVSPVTHAAKIKAPLMIGQGHNDPRVKEAESQQIVDAMKAHKLPVTYVVFPDEGHGFARPENNIAFYGLAEAFLSSNLGGEYLPLTKEEIDASSMQIKEGKDGIPGLP